MDQMNCDVRCCHTENSITSLALIPLQLARFLSRRPDIWIPFRHEAVSSALKAEAVSSSETLVPTNQTTMNRVPEDSNLKNGC
jgi:hypothetical protein